MEPGQTFAQLFVAAQAEILNSREREILALRYGFPSGGYHTFAEIGKQFQLGENRTSVIVRQSLCKIRAKAKRDLIQGEKGACLELILSIGQRCKPNDADYLDRYLAFSERVLSHLPQPICALPLLITLLPPNDSQSRHAILNDLHRAAECHDTTRLREAIRGLPQISHELDTDEGAIDEHFLDL